MMSRDEFEPLIDHLADMGDVYADIVALLKELRMITPPGRKVRYKLNRHSEYLNSVDVTKAELLLVELDHKFARSDILPGSEVCRRCGCNEKDEIHNVEGE